MKLTLISPAWQENSESQVQRFSFFPPLNLGILASLTPPDIDVSIVDENTEPIHYEPVPDLVGITCMTATAPRAYEIAHRFRALGARVVLGGIHPSSVPDEAGQHADAVCVGEAEGIWPSLLDDFQRQELKPIYRARRDDNLTVPVARRDLFPKKGYLLNSTILTTRGCPFSCDFCSVSTFFGRNYRNRPIAEIMAELKSLKDRVVAFVDDNIVAIPTRAKEFFRELIPLKIRWFSQASLTMAKDEELLRLARESGCIGMFMGFESLSPENLASMGKKHNRVEEYEEAVEKIHRHGISIEGAFIFGLDGDDASVFERTVSFVKRLRLEAAQFGILTPLPGTALYRQMDQDARIIDRNWAHYDIQHVVFKPKKMTPAELMQGVRWAWQEFYSWPSIVKRLGLFHRNADFIWALNAAYRKYARNLARSVASIDSTPTATLARN